MVAILPTYACAKCQRHMEVPFRPQIRALNYKIHLLITNQFWHLLCRKAWKEPFLIDMEWNTQINHHQIVAMDEKTLPKWFLKLTIIIQIIDHNLLFSSPFLILQSKVSMIILWFCNGFHAFFQGKNRKMDLLKTNMKLVNYCKTQFFISSKVSTACPRSKLSKVNGILETKQF